MVGDYEAAKQELGDDARRQELLGVENRARVKQQLAQYAISCDWMDNGEVYYVSNDAAAPEEALARLRADADARRADGFDVEMLDAAQVDQILGGPSGRPGAYAGAQRFNYSATFHPGKYLFGLAAGVADLVRGPGGPLSRGRPSSTCPLTAGPRFCGWGRTARRHAVRGGEGDLAL